MKRVLFVFNHPAFYKVRLLNELSKYFDLSVVFERDSNKDRNKSFYSENKYLFNNLKINGVKLGKENFFSTGLKTLIKNNSYDLIIMNGYSTLAETIAIKWMKKHKIPYVLYINGGIIHASESSLKRKIKTSLISGAAYYLSPDENSNKYLIYYGAPKERILNYTYSTIYQSEIIDEPVSKKEKTSLRRILKLRGNSLFVSSGQLIKRKNYIELFKSWNNDDELIIFGEGKERQKLQRFIDKNGLKNIHLEGHKSREEMFKVFKSADAFVFPSNEDIYGHVVNEALSQGLPVISTKKVNSAVKLLKNGENGYLIDDVNKNSINDAINKIKSKDLGKNAIMTAKENTIEIMVKDHVKLFNEVMK